MVKKYIFTSLLVFISSIFVFAHHSELVKISDDAVKRHTQYISQELWRNAWHKRLTILVGVCAATYSSYYLFLKEPSLPSTAVGASITAHALQQTNFSGVSVQVTLDDIKEILVEKIITKEDLKDINQYINEERKKFGTGWTGTFKNWGLKTMNFVVREAAVAVVFSSAVGTFGKYFRLLENGLDKAVYSVFHPGDLQWYIAKHANIFARLSDLEFHAYSIEHKRLPKKVTTLDTSIPVAEIILSEDEITYHKQAFATTWSLCVKDFESILGFMWYTTKKVTQKETENLAKRYQEITKQVYNIAETFRVNCEKLLSKNTVQVGLLQEVAHLQMLFNEERIAFTNCEKA